MTIPFIGIITPSEEIIEIETDRILFFYQKIVGERRDLLTEIVYKTGVPDRPINNSPVQPDLPLEYLGNPSLTDRWWKTLSRGRIDTPLTLDHVFDLIKVAAPSTKFLELHRAYTREDSRVFLKWPGIDLLGNLLSRYSFLWKKGESHEQHRAFVKQHRVNAAGGGGVDDFPNWMLGVCDDCSIMVVETTDQIISQVTTLLHSLGVGYPAAASEWSCADKLNFLSSLETSSAEVGKNN